MLNKINISLGSDNEAKEQLSISRHEWGWPLLFLISMSMVGLQFPLGYLFLPVILIRSFKKDRYDFLIQITLFFGGYALLGEEDLFVKPEDIGLMFSLIGLFICRKNIVLRRITYVMLLYAFAIIILAITSDELMSVQIRRMRTYMMFFYVFVPLMVFANKEFNICIFFKKLFPYLLVLCWFYIIDGYIFSGYILLPNTYLWTEDNLAPKVLSSINNLLWYPFSGYFPRKYPQGLFIVALCVFPALKYYKLSWKQWVVFVLALSATRTMSIMFGLILSILIFQGHIKKILKYTFIALILLFVIYGIDVATGGFLRVQSTFDQFVALDVAQDEEDISEFGSGRLAQAIPKFEELYDLDREWLGLGFLHPELTKDPKFWIKNELYSNIEYAEEVATNIEIGPLQVILDIGYIGLLIHILFFISLYFIIQKYRYANYYITVLVVNFLFGLGGFAGWYQTQGLLLIALSLSVILLENRINKLSQK